MNKNIHSIERVVRIVAGLAILSLLLFWEGNARYWGLIGILPMVTGLIGWCPPYAILGISTCKAEQSEAA